MIIRVIGNVTEAFDTYIAHGCNAQGVMGSGVAKAVREKWPKAYDDYKLFLPTYIKKDTSEALGNIMFSYQPDGKVIINCITQNYYGRDGMKYVSYDAIDECFLRLSRQLKEPGISIPKIGAGLGGGRWEVIEEIIKHRMKNFTVTVWELD